MVLASADSTLPLLAIVAIVVGNLILSVIASRLLGSHQTWVMRMLASLLGALAGATFGLTLGAENLPLLPHLLVFTIAVLVATMLFSVGFGLLAPPPSARPRHATGMPHPLRGLRRTLARWARYIQIMGILARHGLWPYVSGRGRAGRGHGGGATQLWMHVREALEEAGGAFVKLGQLLSTRADLLPPAAIAEFALLQDRVAPAPPEEVTALLATELGDDPAKVFASIERQPIAAASIAQVYRARLISGEAVAVKVQRPGIQEPIQRDLDILLRMSRWVETRAEWARSFGLAELALGFAAALREELDFRVEARNTMTVRDALEARHLGQSAAHICIPRVYAQYSGVRTLVVEWLDGVNVRAARPLLAQRELDGVALAQSLFRCFLHQMLSDGVFHADPHPGNVLLLDDGSLALIDFGSVGRLDPMQRSALQRLLIGIDRRDASVLSDALLDLADGAREVDEEQFERTLAQFMSQYLGSGMPIGAEIFKQLFAVLFTFGLAFPPVIGGVFRALLTLQGTLLLLTPDFEVVDQARAMGGEWMHDLLTPASLRKAATDQAFAMLPLMRRLPRRVDQITAALTHGSLSVNTRMLANASDRRFIAQLVNRVTLAFLGAALAVTAVLLMGMHGGPMLTPKFSVYEGMGYVGLFLGVVLILRVVTHIVREGDD